MTAFLFRRNLNNGVEVQKPVFEAKRIVEDVLKESFYEQMDYHLVNGWVYSGDDCFVMAEKCSKKSLFEQNLNKDVDNDTWFVYVYVGELQRVLELIPHRLEFVGFRRDGGAMRVYSMDRLMRKLEGGKYGRLKTE